MKPNENGRNLGASKVLAELQGPEAQIGKDKRQIEKLQSERDQAQQALKSVKDDNEKLQKTVKDFEDRLKRLESQLHEKSNAVSQIPQPTAITQPQSNTAYQPHPMTQAARLNPTYPTHGAERTISHGGPSYPTQLAAAASKFSYILQYSSS
jgi:cell division septum initiation protein DivIVA